MDIKAEKELIIRELDHINDEALLKAIQNLIEYGLHKEEEHLESTIEEYNKDLEEADAAIERGEYVKHEDALKRIKSWRRKGK